MFTINSVFAAHSAHPEDKQLEGIRFSSVFRLFVEFKAFNVSFPFRAYHSRNAVLLYIHCMNSSLASAKGVSQLFLLFGARPLGKTYLNCVS